MENPFEEIINLLKTIEKEQQEIKGMLQALPKPGKLKTYLNLDELCELADMSKQTVYQYTHTRQIPFIKRGGKLLFKRDDIIKWVEASYQ